MKSEFIFQIQQQFNVDHVNVKKQKMQECETNGWLGLSYEAETEVELQTCL